MFNILKEFPQLAKLGWIVANLSEVYALIKPLLNTGKQKEALAVLLESNSIEKLRAIVPLIQKHSQIFFSPSFLNKVNETDKLLQFSKDQKLVLEQINTPAKVNVLLERVKKAYYTVQKDPQLSKIKFAFGFDDERSIRILFKYGRISQMDFNALKILKFYAEKHPQFKPNFNTDIANSQQKIAELEKLKIELWRLRPFWTRLNPGVKKSAQTVLK